MARARFGSTDYSTEFASLYAQNQQYAGMGTTATELAEANQDAADADMIDRWQNDEVSDEEFEAYATGRMAASSRDPRARQQWAETIREVGRKAKERQEIQQQADDSDAYADWTNGDITDAEWLSYIATRVAGTADDEDPRVHQQWVERQQQYQRSIGDKDAELRYQSGDLSAAQYIAYHRGILAEMKPGSQAYAERQKFITEAVDKEAANDLQTRSQEIITKIPSGDATYKDLLDLYKEAQKNARPNSDIYKTLTAEITKVQATISENEAAGALERIEYLFKAGKLSGAAAGKQIRAVADKYYQGDEAKYYNVLESALGFEKFGGETGASGGSGGGGGGGVGGGGGSRRRSGGGGGGSGGGGDNDPTKAPPKTVDGLRGIINRVEDVLDQIMNGTGPVIDRATGQEIPNARTDPRIAHAIQQQGLDTFDELQALYTKAGKQKEAGKVGEDKTNFIQTKVAPLNTINVKDQAQHLISGIIQTVNATAAESNDPMEVLQAIAKGGQQIDKFLANTTNAAASRVASTDLMATGMQESLEIGAGAARPAEDLPTKAILDELGSWGKAFNQLADPNTSPEQAAAALDIIQKNTGKLLDDSALGPVAGVSKGAKEAYVGLNTGTHVMGVFTETNEDSPNYGELVIGPVPKKIKNLPPANDEGPWVPTMVPDLEFDPSQGESLTTYKTDINGVPTTVWVVARPIPSQEKVWVAKERIVLVRADGSEQVVPKGAMVDSALIGLSSPKTADGLVVTWDDYVDSGAVAKAPYEGFGRIGFQTPDYTDEGKNYPSQNAVMDPNLGSWSVGVPPIASIHRNPDGTIWIGKNQDGLLDDDVKYKPNGTKANQPIFYVGSHPEVVQQLVDEAGIAEGSYQQIDETGRIIPAPADYWKNTYYDPRFAGAERRMGQRTATSPGYESEDTRDDNWWNPKTADAKVRRASEENKRLYRDLRQEKQTKQPSADVMGDIAQFASTFGVKFGTVNNQEKMTRAAVPPPPTGWAPPKSEPGNWGLPTIKAPSTNTAQIAVPEPTGWKPNTTTTRGATSSLPKIAPKTAAPKITAPPPPQIKPPSEDQMTRVAPNVPKTTAPKPTPKASTPGRSGMTNY